MATRIFSDDDSVETNKPPPPLSHSHSHRSVSFRSSLSEDDKAGSTPEMTKQKSILKHAERIDEASASDKKMSPAAAVEEKRERERERDALPSFDEAEMDLVFEEHASLSPSPSLSLSVAPSVHYDEEAHFAASISEAMDLLRTACTSEVHTQAATKALQRVKTLCAQRFHAKARLGASGAAEHLFFLFQRWKEHPEVIKLAAQTISQFVTNENENKILLGCLGLCEEVVLACKAYVHDHQVLFALLRVAEDICNSKLKGLLSKYGVGPANREKERDTMSLSLSHKSTQSQKQSNSSSSNNKAPQEVSSEYLNCDNREALRIAGLCELLGDVWRGLAKHTHAYFVADASRSEVSHREFLVQACRTVSALCSNDSNAKLLGEQDVCRGVAAVLTLSLHGEAMGKGHDTELLLAMLSAVVLLSADLKSGNRLRFSETSVCVAVVDLLHELMRNTHRYQRHDTKNFYALLDYAGWALLNLCLCCPENVHRIQSITYAETVLDNLVNGEISPTKTQKLSQVYEKVFRDPDYLSSKLASSHLDEKYLKEIQAMNQNQ